MSDVAPRLPSNLKFVLATLPAFGRGQAIAIERERIKRQTIQQGRLQHRLRAA